LTWSVMSLVMDRSKPAFQKVYSGARPDAYGSSYPMEDGVTKAPVLVR